MSIIHDALKKVQVSMQQNPLPPNSIKPPEDEVEVLPSSSSGSNKKEKSQFSSWFLIIVSLIILGFSGNLILLQIQKKHPEFLSRIHLNFSFKFLKKESPPKPLAQVIIPQEPIAPKITPTPVEASTPPTNPAPPPPIVLNIQGIMANNNQNVVLINNNVYEEGSVINGQKIVKISLDAITVEHNGQQEVIQIKK